MAEGDCGGGGTFSGERGGDLEAGVGRRCVFGGEGRWVEAVEGAGVGGREIVPLWVLVVVRVHGGPLVATSISYCISDPTT